MDDFIGIIVGIALGIAAIAFIVYLLAMIASVLAGIAWGRGTAVLNYCKSFKENMVDSNKVVA